MLISHHCHLTFAFLYTSLTTYRCIKESVNTSTDEHKVVSLRHSKGSCNHFPCFLSGAGTVVHYDSQMQVLLVKAYVPDALPELFAAFVRTSIGKVSVIPCTHGLHLQKSSNPRQDRQRNSSAHTCLRMPECVKQT